MSSYNVLQVFCRAAEEQNQKYYHLVNLCDAKQDNKRDLATLIIEEPNQPACRCLSCKMPMEICTRKYKWKTNA